MVPAKRYFRLEELAPGVLAAIDEGAGANAGVVFGSEAIAVIDSFYEAEAATALLAEIRRRSALPIRYLVNTHHHVDHVGGNAIFAAAGATLIAQRQVAAWVRPENLRLLGGERISEAQRARVQALQAPGIGYEQQMMLELGGRQLWLRHALGHTGGDTIAWLSDAQVFFMGDLFWRRAAPNLTDARLSDWIATLAAFEGHAGRFVPGHGEPGTAADVADFAGYLRRIDALAQQALDEGLRGAAAEAQALEALRASHGDWAYFKGLAPSGVRHALAERQGLKRVPPPLASPRW
ncbi:MBL fold metallo-hydrolase [Paucibacter sp. APW11]|uniref:MBL fold metallo-hydrolase n=1 Tax=Roseateles aquae TaxID=3077235 RepID=A0ABU3PC89_9BURK|nr:MBL fold metallo-hydrolase [Paucibacter sp. APW11]MDT9000182.1 MBL fold metallo-hydrolase [Paucibacter sp. APW11]